MFANNIKIAFRNMIKHKTFSFINILGLAIGMAACLLILFYIIDEFSYDTFYQDASRIYRVEVLCKNQEGEQLWDRAPAPAANILSDDCPQVENAVRCTGTGDLVVRVADGKYLEKGLHVSVSNDFFKVFTFNFIHGDAATALTQPNSVVIAQDMAMKYFGTTDILGKEFIFDNAAWRITGVFSNLPRNTHLQNFKILTPFSSLKSQWYDRWDGFLVPTYIKLKANTNVHDFEATVKDMAQEYYPEILKSEGSSHVYQLQPLKKIHLYSGTESQQRRDKLLQFSLIGFFILLLSCFNFINLSTARSMTRAKEVSVRKVVGSQKKQLMLQFLLESFVVSFLALLIAVLLVEWYLPYFNDLTGKDIGLFKLGLSKLFILLTGVLAATGFAAGFFPAVVLSRIKIGPGLKGMSDKGIRHSKFREVLVTMQFVIATVLILSTVVIYRQISLMKNSDLGFDKEHMLVIPTQNEKMADVLMKDYEVVKNEFMKHPSIISATAHLRAPGRIEHESDFILQGQGDKNFHMITLFIDPNFISTYQIGMLAGRNFKKEIPLDKGNAFMINEAAVRSLGFTSAAEVLGKKLSYWGGSGEIIGVTKNFNYWSLHRSIQPLVYQYPPRFVPEAMTLKLHSSNLSATLAFLKQTWEKIYPDNPFDYYFLDDDFNQLYQEDERFGKMVFIFTGLALLIACMGLLGLAAFAAQQRTKEIGIRKVLGASVFNIIRLLSREFIKWVILSTLIAWPVAWYFASKWLQNYAYRMDLSPWMFIIVAFLVVLAGLITVSLQAMKAAVANPVEVIKYE